MVRSAHVKHEKARLCPRLEMPKSRQDPINQCKRQNCWGIVTARPKKTFPNVKEIFLR